MCEILADYPLRAECGEIHQALGGRPLPVAQSWMESRYGQDANAAKTHNPLGLFWDAQWAQGPHIQNPPLLIFDDWASAFDEWARRMDTPGYKNGVYAQGFTLEQMIFTYVGGPRCLTEGVCANGETVASVRHYLDETVARLNRYYQIPDAPGPTGPAPGTLYVVEGLAHAIPLSFPLKQMLVPASNTRNRPGIPMIPDRWVQHETDNEAPSAGARNQALYLFNGAEGRQASWHFTVDDTEAWQSIPVDEVAWHGGDGDGPCNMRGVSCELCVNMVGNPQRMAKARRNAEELAAAIMKAQGIAIIEQHHDCCARLANPAGCHSGCPKHIRADGYWGIFVSSVRSQMR